MSVWLETVCNLQGEGYTPDGFSTIWNRARSKAVKDKAITSPFAFNDIRAKSASDDDSAERASQSLGQTS